MELCPRIKNILKGSEEWFTRDKSRSVTCSSETIPESPGVGSALDEVTERMVSNVQPTTARVVQRRIQLHEGWMRKLMNVEDSAPWQEALLHERFSRLTAVLHAREEVQRASSRDSEELSRRCECRSLAQTDQKYELSGGFRNDVILRSLRKRRSGERDEQDLTCAIQHARSEETVIECRAKYSSPTMVRVRT